MRQELYRQMREVEDRHWWFVGRRLIVSSWLSNLDWSPHSRLLDLGCGTGGNLAMLGTFGSVTGVEMDEQARELAKGRHQAPVHEGSLPDNLPFTDETFDCVTMLDVLEHVEEDTRGLEAVRDRLNPSGFLLLTVPAFSSLWGPHDEEHHHFRRYRSGNLRTKLAAAGFAVRRMSYFNTWLFPPIALIRLLQRWQQPGSGATSAEMPARWLNGMLYRLFSSERWLLQRASLPFGVSLIALAQKI
jgi:SAM-dependent methyltransferase